MHKLTHVSILVTEDLASCRADLVDLLCKGRSMKMNPEVLGVCLEIATNRPDMIRYKSTRRL
jgi:hypothetical protein